MRSTYYDFFGELLLEVRGEGGRSTGQLRQMYDHFRVSAPDRDPDVVVERTTETPDPTVVLGEPEDYYGWTGSRFVVYTHGNYMLADPGFEHLYVSPNFEPFRAIYVTEFHLRRRLVDQDFALVHASGVELDGTTTLFPAWRSAGKTNTLLSMLQAGAGFLSDDRLWVSADGDVRGYPLSVNLHPYNVRSFPELERRQDTATKLRRDLSQEIDRRFDTGGSILEKIVVFLNRYYLQEQGRTFDDVRTFFPGADYVERSTADQFVFLQAAPNDDDVAIEEISPETAARTVGAISYYEWDELLEEFFRAYDTLVPGGAALDALETVIEAEERIVADLLEDLPAHRAAVPRSTDWRADGIDRQIVEGVRSLEPQRQVGTAADD